MCGHSCFRLPVRSGDVTIQMAAKNFWILQWSGETDGGRRGFDGVGRNPFRPPRRGEKKVISGAIYPAFKPSARGVTPPNDGLGLEVGCGSGNEEKEQDQMSKSIRTWSMREAGGVGCGRAVLLERRARAGESNCL